MVPSVARGWHRIAPSAHDSGPSGMFPPFYRELPIAVLLSSCALGEPQQTQVSLGPLPPAWMGKKGLNPLYFHTYRPPSVAADRHLLFSSAAAYCTVVLAFLVKNALQSSLAQELARLLSDPAKVDFRVIKPDSALWPCRDALLPCGMAGWLPGPCHIHHRHPQI